MAHTFPGMGRINLRDSTHQTGSQVNKQSEQAEPSPLALDSLVTCSCPGKPIFLGQFTFLSVRKSSKIIAKGTIL